MKRIIIGAMAAMVLGAAALGGGVAEAGNPHCAGNSDNANLPAGHVNDFGGCD